VPVDPRRADVIAVNAVQAVQPLVLMGYEPVVLASAAARRYVKRILERQQPKIVVLSYNEIDTSVQLESEGQVSA